MRYINKELLREKIARRMETNLQENLLSSAVMSVWQDGQEVITQCFGGLDAHTMFRMASMTKPVTAVAVLLVAERGLLSLDDPLEKYLPEFADRQVAITNEKGEVIGREPARQKLTPRLMLSHSCGYVYDECFGQLASLTDEARNTLEGSVAACAKFVLAFHPGESQGYSNDIAWDPLLLLLERLTGMDYLDFITQEIFLPCGMVDTTYLPTDEQYARMAPMHDFVDGQNTERPMERGYFGRFPNTHYLGCIGLYSTLDDYMKFALMLQNGGEYNGRRILTPESVAEMATIQLSPQANPGPQPWGLAVRVIRGSEYPTLPEGAFGWSGAFGTHFWVDPVNRITAVFLKNSCYNSKHGLQITSYYFEEDVWTSLE